MLSQRLQKCLLILGVSIQLGCSQDGGSGEVGAKRTAPDDGEVSKNADVAAKDKLKTDPTKPDEKDASNANGNGAGTSNGNTGTSSTADTASGSSGSGSNNSNGNNNGNNSATTSETSKPAVRSDDGGLTVNVAVSKIEVQVTVGNVMDFKVENNEIYAVHRYLTAPVFSSMKLFGPDGKEIDTSGWTLSFPSNCQNIKPMTQCSSSKIKLASGHSIKGKFTKNSGRRRAWLFRSPGWVRVTDCGRNECSNYGGTGANAPGPSAYHFTLE